MSKNAEKAYVSLISPVGLIVLLVELFTDFYRFLVGFIIAIACRVDSGILAKYW